MPTVWSGRCGHMPTDDDLIRDRRRGGYTGNTPRTTTNQPFPEPHSLPSDTEQALSRRREIALDVFPQAGQPFRFGNEEEDDQRPKDKQLKVRQKIGHAFVGDAKHALGNADDTQIQAMGRSLIKSPPARTEDTPQPAK